MEGPVERYYIGSLALEVAPSHFDQALYGFSPAVGKEDLLPARDRSYRDELLSQLDGDLVVEVGERVVEEELRLPLDGLNHLGMCVPRRRHCYACVVVDVEVAVDVFNHRAVAPCDDEGIPTGERLHKELFVPPHHLQGLGARRLHHDFRHLVWVYGPVPLRHK
jgi:hypothetical protein